MGGWEFRVQAPGGVGDLLSLGLEGLWAPLNPKPIWGFPKTRGPYFGVLIIRIRLFGVLYQGPLFSETPIWAPLNP